VSGQVHNLKVSKTVSPPIRPPVPTDAVFTIDELAVYLKLPKRTLYKLAQEGSVPGNKVGRHWRFRRETIDRWLDGSETS
jgi:excisionase family DNA binding protein